MLKMLLIFVLATAVLYYLAEIIPSYSALRLKQIAYGGFKILACASVVSLIALIITSLF